MQFKITSIILSALAAIASAQNSFNIPASGYALTAGQSTTFTWGNLQGSTVTLSLRQGPSNNLGPPTVIAQSIANTGTFTWNVPASTVQGSNYAIQITDDQNTSLVNFTPLFTITSNVLSSSAAAISTGASTSRATSTSTSVVLVTATSSRTTLVTGVTTTARVTGASSGVAPIATTNGTFTSVRPTTTGGSAPSSTSARPFATGAAGTLAVSAGAGIAALVAGIAALA